MFWLDLRFLGGWSRLLLLFLRLGLLSRFFLSNQFFHSLQFSKAIFNLFNHIISLSFLFSEFALQTLILLMHIFHLLFVTVGDFHDLLDRHCCARIRGLIIHGYHGANLILEIFRLLFVRKHQFSSILAHFAELLESFRCDFLLLLLFLLLN